jgi:hypothetical protein
MSRFLALLAVAAVAGAMYVAAAPGGLRSAGPSRAQFKALKLRVTKLEKSVGQVKKLSVAEALVLADCLMYHAQAVDDYGDGANKTYGYSYTDPQQNGGQPYLTTALDVAPSTETTSQFYFLGVNPACVSSINTSAASSAGKNGTLRHLLAVARARERH